MRDINISIDYPIPYTLNKLKYEVSSYIPLKLIQSIFLSIIICESEFRDDLKIFDKVSEVIEKILKIKSKNLLLIREELQELLDTSTVINKSNEKIF
ncbi:hypothetical protein [Spiroplasma taiwanense]|uniref:Uncharacterized protein n=1 Tax=Spiroplasma taiwanense CT-1 TaxID=1276220 RepID=S5LT12_9MOLU|nr:hypothetical protein [Spiroplasma taiwanense]AGR40824.1 hypothetical protein STAIW_v1c01380 [Spiroplasma taiwanense CT-1]